MHKIFQSGIYAEFYKGGPWSFLLCTITWYNVLCQVNCVSKLLINPNLSPNISKETTLYTREWPWSRENGLASCQTDTTDIAENLDMEISLPEKRQPKKKIQFLYEWQRKFQSRWDFQKRLLPALGWHNPQKPGWQIFKTERFLWRLWLSLLRRIT